MVIILNILPCSISTCNFLVFTLEANILYIKKSTLHLVRLLADKKYSPLHFEIRTNLGTIVYWTLHSPFRSGGTALGVLTSCGID